MTPQATSNPYWEAVKSYPSGRLNIMYSDPWQPDDSNFTRSGKSPDPARTRRPLSQKYSWAIPHPKAITWLAGKTRETGVVEIGAGRGYWAELLAAEGVVTICYDKAPADVAENSSHPGGELFHPVHQGGVEAAGLHPERALFLCWPPYNKPMAREALQAYQGNVLIYIGESEGGCTADNSFFDLLKEEWELVDECRDHIAWYQNSDRLTIYKRK